MLWLLVSGSISSGLVPGVEASEQPMRMQGAQVGPRTGRPHPQGLGPNSQQDCQGGLVQTLPTTSSWGCTSQGASSCPFYLPWTLLRQAEPQFPPSGGTPSVLGLGFLRSPPSPQQLTRPAQGSLVILPPSLAPLWGTWKAFAPNSPARPPLSLGLWHS